MRRRFMPVGLVAWFVLLAPWSLPMTVSAAADPPDFRHILRAYDGPLAAVTSDTDAKAVFTTHLSRALDLQDILSTPAVKANASDSGSANQNAVSSDPGAQAIRLTADLAAWRLATALKRAADAGGRGELQTVLESTEPQRRWLIEEREFPFLNRAARLASIWSSFPPPAPESSQVLPRYDEYAQYLDRTYPRFIESDDSWLASAEQEGVDGIQRRLASFWNQPAQAASSRVQIEEKKNMEDQYFALRLRPVLAAHLVALTIRAETEAEQRAHRVWLNLKAWQEKRREGKGLTRLCGTWQWTVHNHQNHQEHKMMMVFPPPEGGSSIRTHPTTITVLGNGVYLRWDFQGGYQEDSLLFTGEGQRLEGSFVNSGGAWGSITGKRMAACGK